MRHKYDNLKVANIRKPTLVLKVAEWTYIHLHFLQGNIFFYSKQKSTCGRKTDFAVVLNVVKIHPIFKTVLLDAAPLKQCILYLEKSNVIGYQWEN